MVGGVLVFEKRKAKKAAREVAQAQQRAANDAAEYARLTQAWREYLTLCYQRLEAARSFEGTTGAEVPGCPIALKPSEKVFLIVEGAVLVEPRRTAGHWQGGSHGVSVRVPGTKSMRYRVGATRGTYVQGAEVPTPIDEGSFTVTTLRAVFVGSKASREWQWAKVLGVMHADDVPWIAIAVSNRQKTSGVGVDAQTIDALRFSVDLAIANATGTRDELVRELAGQLSEQRKLAPAGADIEIPR